MEANLFNVIGVIVLVLEIEKQQGRNKDEKYISSSASIQ